MKLTKQQLNQVIKEEYEGLADPECATELIHRLVKDLSEEEVDVIFQQVYERIVGTRAPRPIGFQTSNPEDQTDETN